MSRATVVESRGGIVCRPNGEYLAALGAIGVDPAAGTDVKGELAGLAGGGGGEVDLAEGGGGVLAVVLEEARGLVR